MALVYILTAVSLVFMLAGFLLLLREVKYRIIQWKRMRQLRKFL